MVKRMIIRRPRRANLFSGPLPWRGLGWGGSGNGTQRRAQGGGLDLGEMLRGVAVLIGPARA